jgi:hypothetical protein
VSRHATAATTWGEGMTVSEIQPNEEAACQATTMIAGKIHPIHDWTRKTLGRRAAFKSRGQTLSTGLSAISVNPTSPAH